MNEEVHVPFEIKEGNFYSVIDNEVVVGVFISNGIVEHYPNGDADGFIWYKIHACLFNDGSVLKPIILAGPEINGNNGVRYPRELSIRYANENEKKALVKKLKSRKLCWNEDRMKIEKIE